MKEMTRPVYAEVNLNHIKYNLRQLKKKLNKDTKVMAVVKADAYGHGAIPVSKALIEEGIDRLGVALPEEGAELREGGIDIPIQVLGETLSPQEKLLIKYDLIPTVARKDTLEKINKLAINNNIIQKIHIKIETGMGRIGFLQEEGIEVVSRACHLPGIEVEGLVTHFATADEINKEYAHQQWKRFNCFLSKLKEKGIDIPLKHAANSATIIDLPQYQLNMVRPGIALYGLPPSDEVNNISLKPALSWKTAIIYLKELPAGSAISYGATYITKKKSRIATIPVGYADGYSRLLSNKGYVLIKGKKATIRGRVCMDQFMVDVTDIPDVEVGDEVVLIGNQGDKEFTASEMADIIGTINYEVLCNISMRVPRIHRGGSYDRKRIGY